MISVQITGPQSAGDNLSDQENDLISVLAVNLASYSSWPSRSAFGTLIWRGS